MQDLLSKDDYFGKTPTSYAFKHWPSEIISKILSVGLQISQQDMELLSPEILEDYLNENCISYDFNDRTVLHFNYSFLQDRSQQKTDSSITEIFCNESEESEETEGKPRKFKENGDFLYHMAHSEKHRRLVVHPVIVTFLWVKWNLLHFPLRRY